MFAIYHKKIKVIKKCVVLWFLLKFAFIQQKDKHNNSNDNTEHLLSSWTD